MAEGMERGARVGCGGCWIVTKSKARAEAGEAMEGAEEGMEAGEGMDRVGI